MRAPLLAKTWTEKAATLAHLALRSVTGNRSLAVEDGSLADTGF